MSNLEKITLGGGCFWCIEAVYLELKGVEKAVSGYAAGHVENPTYKQICTGTTGHAEVVQVHFDPNIVSLEDILKIFFTVHNPTTKDRQGNDVGPQYRSIILFHNDEQKMIAQEIMEFIEKENLWDDPLVTELAPLDKFYVAEEYHQNYYDKNPNAGYCRIVIQPKVAKFRKKYFEKLKEPVKKQIK